jgi:hypothetical protein
MVLRMILITFLFSLTGCQTFENSIYKKGSVTPFEPREYYRTFLDSKDVGTAFLSEVEDHSYIRNELLTNKQVQDAIILKNNNKYVIAIKPNRFHRSNKEGIINHINKVVQSNGISAYEIYTHPKKYRLANLLYKRRGIDPSKWTEGWKRLLK